MSCPLCSAEQSVKIRSYPIDELKQRWERAFGFDPFPKFEKPNMEKLMCANCRLIHFDPAYFGDGKFYEKLSFGSWYYEENK